MNRKTQKITWTVLVLVGLGGGLGSASRYLVGGWLPASVGEGIPWGTLFVNVVGSTILGFVAGAARAGRLRPAASSFLAAGFCGGFTTFSAFDLEVFSLIAAARHGAAVAYIGLSTVSCIAGVALGLWIIGTPTGRAAKLSGPPPGAQQERAT